MLTKIDELNRPEYEAISYEEYFAPMDIPEEDKEKRVKMAEDIDDIYYEFFAMIATMTALQQYLDWDYLNDYLNTRLYDKVEEYEYSATRDYLNQYVDISSQNTVETTLDHQGEEYYLSDERASRLAAENAQTIANYTELQDAILAGYTHKTWKAELTKATRKDHREMNGKTIPIMDYFKFPDCQGLCPHDEVNMTARQVANCMCSLVFKTKTGVDKDNDGNELFTDVTSEYIDNATPKQGKYLKSPYFSESNNEEAVGEWIYNKFGGDLTLLAEDNPEGTPNPDYLWNGKLWDLKYPKKLGKNNIDNLVHKGIRQIRNNPGGVILDKSLIDIDIESLQSIITERLKRSAMSDMDVLIKDKEDVVKIIRYKIGK